MNRFPVAALAVLCACTSSNLANEVLPPTANPGAVIDGEFIVRADIDEDILRDLDLDKVDYDDVLGAGLYRTDGGTSLTAIRALFKQSLPFEVHVEENRVIAANATSDPYRYIQWNLDMIRAEEAWTTSTGAGVVVAVVDSGVATYGEDAPINLVAGYDFVDNDSDPTDENGHGTHVAGTVAQATDNGRGVAGVAPDAAVMPIRVLDRYGSGSVYWSAKGVRWATDNGADVINLSLGSPYSSSVERSAIDYAVGNDVVVVAASGNAGKSTLDYPAAYDGVISVGAVGGDGRVTGYSNGGVDLVAPGGDMGADNTGDGYVDGILQETLSGSGTSYQFFEGTSMATPHVAAAAALLLGAGAQPWEVEDLLIATADDMDATGWDNWSGYGLIDPVEALGQVSGTPGDGGGSTGGTTPPADDTTAPAISNVTGSRNGSSMTIAWTTDEPATSEIEFEDYGLFGDPEASTTSHELQFTIDPNETYYFTLISVDDAGNRGESGVWYMAP